MNQQDFNKKADKLFSNIWTIIVVLFVLFCVYAIVTDVGKKIMSGISFIGNKMDRNDSKKQRCIEETYNIKNEFTAKQKYKACMRR